MFRLREQYPYYLGGKAEAPNSDLVVTNKYTDDLAARVALADEMTLERAITAAAGAAPAMRQLPSYARRDVLHHLVARITERHEELARIVCIEAGKPIRDARGEVTRMIDTFRTAAEEATRMTGEVLPLDISERTRGVHGLWRRFPVGPCGFITPFNFPLNLVAHKVGPALAVGCPFVLKPASSTPISAVVLGEILAEADLPDGAFSILPCSGSVAERLATDGRIKLLSFTGSPDVGWALKAKASRKKVTLELGGNAAVVVDEDADVERAAERIVIGAFYQSGQSCISVQRIIAHERAYAPLQKRLCEKVAQLKAGDPMEEDTFIGPLITQEDAERIEHWVAEAVGAGATVLCGGQRHGAFYEPTLLENVPANARLSCQEVFGPVAVLERFTDFAAAISRVNDSRYGLQAGVFTSNLHHAFYAFEHIEAGGVIINEVPSFRVDSMPYGGVKDSGFGREGVRFSMEGMTEMRLMVLHQLGELPVGR